MRPSGDVTFLFTDVEGSTERWERDSEAMAAALERHNQLVRNALEAHGGYVFKTMGDAVCAAFGAASDAVEAALRAQRALLAEDFSAVDGLRVRMALHAGYAQERDGDYFGPTLNRVARLVSIGSGGQVLISGAVAELLQDAASPDATLRDLGGHRLKDLSRPERVYQLVAAGLLDDFQALRSLDYLPNNLPQQQTSFVGRAGTVAEIKSVIEAYRLVTLVGTGGAGKTRCAIQTGAELLDHYADGVWLVELASIADPALVTTTIAQTLGVREVRNEELLVTVISYLGRRSALLILDNCEHVADETRRICTAILRACAGVRIVATSREPLAIAGERVYQVPSLDARDAVELFVDRAQSADARFVLTGENAAHVAEICRRLDGIPLALELAAARVKLLSLRQLTQRLNERFRLLTGGDKSALPRQQTLRATIDWSFDLLDEPARALFRKLAIFAGGCSLDAAAAVCSESAGEWEVLDALSSLVDKSLVVVQISDDDRRYQMLTSLREYAAERLAEAHETGAMAGAHARYMSRFAGSLVPLATRLEDATWQRSLGPDVDNLRAAIDWTIVRGNDPQTGLQLLADLEWPELLVTPHEALRWYEAAIAREDAMPGDAVQARLLRHCVVLGWLSGRPTAEREALALRAVEAARRAGDADVTARALADLGATHSNAGRFDEAESAFATAYATPELLSPLTTNALLRMWAVSSLQRGDMDLARRRFSEVVVRERRGSEAHASALLNLAELEFAAGNIEAARVAASQAKASYANLNSIYTPLVLANLAAYAMAAGDLDEARSLLREALDLQHKGEGRWLNALIEHHALLAALLNDYQRAAQLAGYADALRTARGESRHHTERRQRERLSAMLTAQCSKEEIEAAVAAGARLTQEEALRIATAIHA